MHGNATDEELMLEIKAGSKTAFNELFQRYEGCLYRYLVRRCGNRYISDELFQDVWERLYKSRDDFSPGAGFRAYFYRIAHNRVVDYYRREGRQVAGQQVDTVADSEIFIHSDNDPHDMLVLEQQHKLLLQELAHLPEEQREIFILREESGMSLNEIAGITGISYETAKSRLRYAVKKLQERLRNNE